MKGEIVNMDDDESLKWKRTLAGIAVALVCAMAAVLFHVFM